MSKVLFAEADESSVILGSVEHLLWSPSAPLCHIGQTTEGVSGILGNLKQH